MPHLEKTLKTLMRDYGYRVSGKDLIAIGIRGFTADRIIRSCRDVVDAAEQLCPIVAEQEYTHRLTAAMTPQD